jgi:hypothetical protein
MNQALFIGVLSLVHGQALSIAGWALSKPAQFQTPEDITKTLGDIIKHPDRDAYAWSFSDDPFLVHAQADPRTLDPVLAPLVAAGVLTQADLDATAAKIVLFAGGQHTILEVMPGALVSSVKDFQTMQADGWFPPDDEAQPEA